MRKLATSALGYTIGVLLAHYVLPGGWILPVSVLFLAMALVGLFFKQRARYTIILVALFSSVGLLWSFGYSRLFALPCRGLDGVTEVVSAEILSYPEQGDFYSMVKLKLREEGFPGAKVTLYSSADRMEDLRPGDRVEVRVRLSYFESGGGSFDNMAADGIFLLAYTKERVAVTGRSGLSFIYLPKIAANALKGVVGNIFAEGIAPFITALLIGDRRALYGDQAAYDALMRSGLLHVVAVSGMHISYLVGFVRQFSGKRRLAHICIPVIIFFIAMTGVSPSIFRAGVMQIVLLLAPLLKRENDEITTFSAVLFLQLIVNPMSITSASLQLSYASVAGIMFLSPRIFDAMFSKAEGLKAMENGIVKAAVRFVCTSISTTLGGVIFTAPLVAAIFGYVSLVAPIANLLALPLVTLTFLCSLVSAILGVVSVPLGIAAAFLCAVPARAILVIADALTRFVFSAVYVSNPGIVLWLVYTYGIFGLAFALKGKEKFRPAVPICMSVLVLLSVLLYTSLSNDAAGGKITAVDVGQGQSIVMLSGASTVVIDCGGNAYGGAGAGVANYINSENRSNVDLLVLTHFHSDHTNGVPELMRRLRVKRLVLPFTVPDDGGALPEILAMADYTGAEIFWISADATAALGRLSLEIYAPLLESAGNEAGLCIVASFGDFDVLITGDAGSSVEMGLLLHAGLPDIELLITGHHGSKYSTSGVLLDAVTPEFAFISVGRNSYGHPTQEVLDRLMERDIAIYRTDLNGSVTLTLRK